MNKGELTKAVAESAGMSQADAGKAVDAVFDTISGAVKSRKQVAIAGFGTFHAKTRGAREGRSNRWNTAYYNRRWRQQRALCVSVGAGTARMVGAKGICVWLWIPRREPDACRLDVDAE